MEGKATDARQDAVSVWCHLPCKTSVAPPQRQRSASVVGIRTPFFAPKNAVLGVVRAVSGVECLLDTQALQSTIVTADLQPKKQPATAGRDRPSTTLKYKLRLLFLQKTGGAKLDSKQTILNSDEYPAGSPWRDASRHKTDHRTAYAHAGRSTIVSDEEFSRCVRRLRGHPNPPDVRGPSPTISNAGSAVRPSQRDPFDEVIVVKQDDDGEVWSIRTAGGMKCVEGNPRN